MSAKASGPSNERPSFGRTHARWFADVMRTQPRHTESARAVTAIALVLMGALFGFGTSLLLGTRFLTVRFEDSVYVGWWRERGHSLVWLASHDAGWAIAAGAVAVVPLWFLWWRRSAMAFGRTVGVLLAVAGGVGTSVCAAGARPQFAGVPTVHHVGGAWYLLVVTSAGFAAAFLIAPAPSYREAINELSLRGLLRRHRKSF